MTNRRSYPATLFLALLVLVGTIVQAASGFFFAPPEKQLAILIDLGAITPDTFVNREYTRLAVAWFLHGGIIHVLGNVWILVQVSAAIDLFFGARYVLASFILGGLLASIASAAALVNEASVGASGAIFALVGSLLVWLQKCDALRNQKWARTMFLQIGIWATWSILTGFISEQIDNAAHVGGFFGGILLALVVPVKLRAGNLRDQTGNRGVRRVS